VREIHFLGIYLCQFGMNGLNAAQLSYETNNSHYEKTDNSYFCIFGARHDAGLVREPARDNRNDVASDYDKYGAYAHAAVITVATAVATVATVHGSDYRRRPLSRQQGGSKAVTCTAVIRFTACQRPPRDSRGTPCGRSLSWNISLPIRYEWIEGSAAFYETNMSGLGARGFR
jgi:hypothetical protein